ncbi:MAG: transcription termination factor Rho, partial [Gordonibacter sp.]
SNTRPVQTNNNANRPNNRPNNSRPNNNGGKQQGNNGSNQRRQRRPHNNNQGPREVQPSVSRDDLLKLKVAELRAKAEELGVDGTGLKKAELIEAVFSASVKAEGFIEVSGILDILADGYGFLRTQGYLPSETDCYVGLSTIRRNGLRKGDLVSGQTRPARENEKYAAIQKVTAINGTPIEECGNRLRFGDLTPVYPDECLSMEHGKTTVTARVIDLVSPIGKGQRGLIVSPPKAGKTTILKDIAAAISANNPEVHLMCLLVDERPEEVTDMERSIKGEVVSSTFDMPTENHIAVSELVIERAKRLVECGKDVVVLLDSLTRLARAYNLAQPASGRILSGGVDSTALYPPKRFLGAARNIEGGGSLTILASALVDTGSKMDEVIFEEFKGTGNMELKLDRNLADRRIFPAIDPVASGTRKEELLLDPQEAPLIWAVRRILANTNNTERAMDMLIKSLKQTDTNQEFLLRTAKKAQHSKGDAIEI